MQYMIYQNGSNNTFTFSHVTMNDVLKESRSINIRKLQDVIIFQVNNQFISFELGEVARVLFELMESLCVLLLYHLCRLYTPSILVSVCLETKLTVGYCCVYCTIYELIAVIALLFA